VIAVALVSAACDGAASVPAATPTIAAAPATAAPTDANAEDQAEAVDEDDGATVGSDVPPLGPASTIDPTAGAVGRLPDPGLTPGILNPAVTQATIGVTICVVGWTAIIRPSSSYTTALKIKQLALYGYADTSTSDYEEDHLISLELGGAPTDPANLWPEPYSATLADGRSVGARVKDQLETTLKRDVCAGTMSLAEAQSEVGIHWVHAYYGIPLAPGGPSPSASPTPSQPPTGPPPARLALTEVSLTSSVARGATASVSIRTASSARCTIVVTYNSGPSKASGLVPKTATGTGRVTWSWKVGTRTALGRYPIDISCSKAGQTGALALTFAVT
jgi:hypothetical protein